ncbi:hypothetical protein KP509_08G005600 [Ceratopteris richardii]|uniref:Nodulin-like domain-containing protein n=1 Tax=Ceratopteris richardii TaxID=49495 RepID=A0A8T2UDS2_CERRI|nr:hypothetical protein KP509_08G005600 [Ceratopteris richardii]
MSQMCFAIFVGGNSTTWFNTAVLVTCMRNFPRSRGNIVGFLKGFVGLSGAIFMQIFFSLLDKNAVKLLLFLALGPAFVCFFCMGFVRPVPPSTGGSLAELDEEKRQFWVIYVICVALAIYLFIAAFLDKFVINYSISLTVAIVMFLFLIAPIVVPVRVFLGILLPKKGDFLLDSSYQPSDEPDTKRSAVDIINDNLTTNDEDLSFQGPKFIEAEEENTELLLALGEGAVKRRKRRPRRGEDFKLKQALIKADYWLLFLTFCCGIGSCITVIDNLSQLGQAQGYSDVSIFVMLNCIWGFLGRLGSGYVSEHFIRATTTPRSFWIGAAQALMVIAHLLFAFAVPGSLYIASSIVGLCQGVQIAATVPTVSEVFGLKHFGILYNFIILADPVGSLLFSTFLAGSIYDAELIKEYGSAAAVYDTACTGAHCFRLTFLLLAVICTAGVVLSIILTVRLKPVYVTLYGTQDSTNASYSSLPSQDSYTLMPSVESTSSASPPVQFVFPEMSSSATSDPDGQ